jgi:hypothetical protein
MSNSHKFRFDICELRYLVIALVLVVGSPAMAAQVDGERTPETVILVSDAPQPHLAIGQSGIYVTCIYKGNIVVSVSRDNGNSFGTPVVAIDVGGRARGGRHRGPRIGVDARGRLTVTAPVTFDPAEFNKRYPTRDLFFVQSADSGKTWTKPVRVNDVAKQAPEALHWMSVAPSGEANVAWLDMRSRERGQDIYFAQIKNGKVSENTQVATTVCECCAPGLAVDSRGKSLLAFREGGDAPSREIFALYSSGVDKPLTDRFRVNTTETKEDG